MTDAERKRLLTQIQRAQEKVRNREAQLEAARTTRDRLILDAIGMDDEDGRPVFSKADIIGATGLKRPHIYNIIKRKGATA